MTVVSALSQALLAGSIAWEGGLGARRFMLSISVVLAASVLLSHVLHGKDLISPMIAGLGIDTGQPPAFMSSGTALSILLIAAVTWPSNRRSPTWLLNTATSIVFLIALLVLVGYLYGPADLASLLPFRSMSVNSGISLLLLSVATILSRPEVGWAKVIASPEPLGKVTRGQMVFACLPAALGLVLVRAIRAEWLPVGAAMALLVVFTIMPLLWLILRDGNTLASLDAERAERLRLVQRYGADLQMRLNEQAGELQRSNAKLLAIAEASSAQNAARYRQLFDSIDAGFCVVEMTFDSAGEATDYRFVEVNAAFEAHTGLADAEGKWMRDLAPQHEQHWFDLYGAVARTGKPTRFESPASELGARWYDVYAFRVGDARDNLVGILFNDITARRTAELELRAVNETLEQRVEATIAEREEAQAALLQSQKMEAIGQLTGGVAHDFNNLLTPIIGSLDLLTRRGGLGEREQRLISAAMQAAERAKTLVQRLLAFARRQPLQPGPVDLAALVTNMAELVSSTTGPQIRVSVDVASDLPPAVGDANQLEMAILNLCVNARDAMPDGGRLSLSVAPSERPQGHADLPVASYIRLSVADEGTGMDAATAARAIEPFFSTKGIGKGTGLGLSMVHGLAQQLGGALTIQSRLGLGTRIDLFLRTSPATLPASSDVASPSRSNATGHILVIDDHEDVRGTTVALLHELGFTTEDCGSAAQAQVRLREGDLFDLVVTDHLMPGLTGAELAVELNQSRPGLPVLVISGFVDADNLAPSLNFLRKPFRKDELAEAVDAALDRRSASQRV